MSTSDVHIRIMVDASRATRALHRLHAQLDAAVRQDGRPVRLQYRARQIARRRRRRG